MKKTLLLLVLLIQTLIVSAFTPDPDLKTAIRRATRENVKVYRQASTSTEALWSLKSNDEVKVIRRHNSIWSLVSVNDQVGYVLTSEIYKPKKVKNGGTAPSARLR
jgi:hypothetical protein